MQRHLRRPLALISTLAVASLLWPWHVEAWRYEGDPQTTDFGEIRALMQPSRGLSRAGPWPRAFDRLLATRLSGPPYDLVVSVDVPNGALGAVSLTQLDVTDVASGKAFALAHRATRLEPLLSDTGSVFRTEFGGVVPLTPRHGLRLQGAARLDFKDKRRLVVARVDLQMQPVHEERWTNALLEYWEGM